MNDKKKNDQNSSQSGKNASPIKPTNQPGNSNTEDKQLFRTLVENSPDYIARYDRNFRRIYVNAAMQQLFKNIQSNILGETPVEQSPLHAPKVYIDNLKQVFDSGVECSAEMAFQTANGEMHWGHIRFVPEFDQNEQVVTVLTVGRDINELRVNEQNFQMLADNFPDFVARFNRKIRFTYANQALVNILGKPPGEIVGKALTELQDLVGSTQVKRLTQLIGSVFKDGKQLEIETHWDTPTGDRFFDIRFIPEADATTKITSVMSIAREITDQKRSEAVNATRLHLLQFAESHNLIDLLEETLNETEKLTSSSLGFYHFVDEDKKSLTLQNWSTRTQSALSSSQGNSLLPGGKEVSTWLDRIRRQKAIIHNSDLSVNHFNGFPKGFKDVTRELVIPVIKGKKIQAVFGVGNKPSDYDSKDSQIIQVLADLVGEIAERKMAEIALRESEEKFRSVFCTVEEALTLNELIYNDRGEIVDYRILEVNPAFEKDTGFKRDLVVGKTATELYGLTSEYINAFWNASRQNAPNNLTEMHIESIDVWKHINASRPIDGKFVISYFDITEHKRAEEKLKRLNRELRAISDCNQTLMRAEDESTLLKEVCKIICEEAGYRLAWVGFAEHDKEKTIRPVAWADQDSDYVAQAKLSWDENQKHGQGPAGEVIRTGKSVQVQDFKTDQRMEPWREAALQRGYRSGIALPLKDDLANVFGALLIYSADVNAITPEESRLMEELANDLAFGITAIRTRDRKKIAEIALRNREEFISSIVENIPDMIFIKDAKDLKFVRVNKAAEQLLGLKRSDLIGKSDFDFFTKEQAEFFTKNDRKVLGQGIKLDIEEEPIKTSRGERLLHTKKIPIPDENGNPAYVLGISEDITEHKALEAQLITRAREFRTLVENIPDFIVRYNKDLVRTFVNSAWEKASGLTEKQVVNVSIDKIPGVKQPVIAEYEEKLRSVLRTGESQTIEFEWTNAHGDALNLEYTIVPEYDQTGAIKGVLAVGHDLTHRKQIEAALTKSQAELETLFGAMTDVIFVGDSEGRYLEIPETNPSLLYKPSQDLIGKTLHEVFPKEQADFFLSHITEALETNKSVNFEYCLQIREEEIWFNASISPMIDNKILMVARDISRHKEAETERLARLHFFRSMDRINRAIQGVDNLEGMMSDVLDTMLTIFKCDRARLINPCDPDSTTWTVAMERNQPDFPCVVPKNVALALEPADAELFGLLRNASGPVQLHPTSDHPIGEAIAQRCQVKSMIASAVYPKIGKPWAIGLDQCSHPRIWTEHEERLVQAIAERVGDAITSLLSIRELRASEERYRLIAENTADVIHILSLDLKSKYVSPSVKNNFGYSVQEALGKKLEELLPPDSVKKVHEILAYQLSLEQDKSVDPNRSVLIELEEYHKDGRIIPVELSASFLRDDHQQPLSILTVIRNITKRKQAQMELVESEQKFRSLAESIPDNIIRHDLNKSIVYFNKNMINATDVDLSTEIGRGVSKKIMATSPPGYLEKLDRVIQFGTQEELEIQVRNQAGEMRMHNIRFVPERDGNGKIIGVIAVGRDITEIKQVQESLRKLFHAVEQSPVSIMIANTEAKIEYVNPQFTLVTGYTSEEALGRNPRFLKSGNLPPEFYTNMWDTISGGKIWHGEFHNRKKNGTFYFESASISPVFDDDGSITHYIAIKEDITTHKMLEQQLRQAQKMEAIGQLAGGVAHDFNNMLGVIIGYSELGLRKVDQSQAIYSDLTEIFKAANRSADLTRQLLTFARKQTVVPKVINLNETINGMLKMLQRLLTERITLHWKPGVNLWKIKMDPTQVDQVLANLCVNGRDAIDGIGEIVIGTSNQTLNDAYCALNPELLPGNYVLLTVSDNGAGMDEATRDRIFEPFFTTKETGKGTGLGLATIYGIIKQNDAYINVESKPGVGSTFNVYLPAVMDDRETTNPGVDATQYDHLGDKTVLVVEDELSILRLTQEILENLGYRVLTANSPKQALSIAKEHNHIDILITDVIMPEMDGRSLAGILKEFFPELKCLFMSGYSGEIISPSEATNEEIHFIQKPFSLRDLKSALNELDQG